MFGLKNIYLLLPTFLQGSSPTLTLPNTEKKYWLACLHMGNNLMQNLNRVCRYDQIPGKHTIATPPQQLLLTLMKKEKHRVYDNKESSEKSKSLLT